MTPARLQAQIEAKKMSIQEYKKQREALYPKVAVFTVK